MIWLTPNLMAKTKKIEIIPRIKSDHNPVLWSGENGRKSYRWRLNEDLFFNEKLIDSIRQKTKLFFQINIKKDSKIQRIWDAYKATVRGELITLNAFEKKKKEKLEVLQNELRKKR